MWLWRHFHSREVGYASSNVRSAFEADPTSTLDRPMTPFRPPEILVGKSVPALVIGLAEGTVIISVAVFWFQVPLRGCLLLLYAGLFLYIIALIGIGLMISSISRTQQQAILGAFLFVVPAVILSGFATPIANMPPLIRELTLINPMRYFFSHRAGHVLGRAAHRARLRATVADGRHSRVTLTGATWIEAQLALILPHPRGSVPRLTAADNASGST